MEKFRAPLRGCPRAGVAGGSGRQRGVQQTGPRADTLSRQSCCGTKTCARTMLCWAQTTSLHSAEFLVALCQDSIDHYLLSRTSMSSKSVCRARPSLWTYSQKPWNNKCLMSLETTKLLLQLRTLAVQEMKICHQIVRLSMLHKVRLYGRDDSQMAA